VVIRGHKTSVSLEPEFWFYLKDVVRHRKTSLTDLIDKIDRERQTENLSSALRLYVFKHMQSRLLGEANAR
jgi:predicted DNA-binding ribbon-helix-helix protein